MKKNIIYAFSVLMATFAVSCTSEMYDEIANSDKLVVTAEYGNASRTELGDDSKAITWSENDKIYLFNDKGSDYSFMSIAEGVGEKTATFTGHVIGELSNLNKALYPVPATDDGKYTMEFPAERSWSENSLAPMIGDFSSNHVGFRNLTAMFRIDLDGCDIKDNSVLKLIMDKDICGTFVVDVENETVTIENGGKEVSVSGLSGARFVDIPLPAGTYSGYKVELDGTVIAESNESKELKSDDVAIVGKVADEIEPDDSDGAYLIKTTADLFWFAEEVNGGNTFKGETVRLANDINLANKPWTPITGFKGTFDGAEFTISNLNVAVTGKASAGLFADAQATIKNLYLKDVTISGNYKAGAIVGDGLCAKIENCHVIGGTITSTPYNKDDANHVGGIVGYLSSEPGTTATEPAAWVKDCTVTGLNITAYRDVAGIVGTTTGYHQTNPELAKAIVTGNTISNTTIIADQTVDYKEPKAANAGEIVGRKQTTPTMSDNTVGEGVNVEIRISQVDDLKESIKAKNANIKLAEGVYELNGFNLAEGVTITGENKDNVILKGYLTSTINNVTIKDVVIEGSNTQRWAYAKGTLFFENCTFNAKGVYALHFDGITDADITYKDCKIIGWVAITDGAKSLTFDGCEIIGNGTYGVIRTYGDATIKNCHFDVDNVNKSDVYQDGIHAVDCTVIVEKCVNVNGELEKLFNVSGTGKIEVK